MRGIPDEYVPKGKHPATGEAFVKCVTLSEEQPYDRVVVGPPSAPTRAVYEYDEAAEDMVYVRDLSDAEMDAEHAAYEKAMKEWSKTGGVHHVIAGPFKVDGTFATESGATADGRWVDGEWVWTGWES